MNKAKLLTFFLCLLVLSFSKAKPSMAFVFNDSPAIEAALDQCNANTSLAALTIEGCYEGLQMMTSKMPQRNRNFSNTQNCITTLNRLNFSQISTAQFQRCDDKWTHIYFRQGCKEATTTYLNSFDIVAFCTNIGGERKTAPVFQRSNIQNNRTSLTATQQSVLNNALADIQRTPPQNNTINNTAQTQGKKIQPRKTTKTVAVAPKTPETKQTTKPETNIKKELPPTKKTAPKEQEKNAVVSKTTKTKVDPKTQTKTAEKTIKSVQKVDQTKTETTTKVVTPTPDTKSVSPKEFYAKTLENKPDTNTPATLAPSVPLAFQVPQAPPPNKDAFASVTNVGLAQSNNQDNSLIVPFKQTTPQVNTNSTTPTAPKEETRPLAPQNTEQTNTKTQEHSMFEDAIPQSIGGMPTTGGVKEARVESKHAQLIPNPFASSTISTQNPTSIKDTPVPIDNKNIQGLSDDGNKQAISTLETPQIGVATNATTPKSEEPKAQQKKPESFPPTGLQLSQPQNLEQKKSTNNTSTQQLPQGANQTGQFGIPGFFSNIDQTQVLPPNETSPKGSAESLALNTNSTLQESIDIPQTLTQNAPAPPSSEEQNYRPDPR
ncbi:hypothetical protein [Desulfovibrio litoralis]|uniref:Uncharacterized protein n=1 Tax=Desulfovibrio litoralis DSM 11393 TaxID=1121455 RepID=A0A1M7TFM2_9BACT|nr:hypothetical protein [Desulfovibrio litoralis]SHN69544.1 hypothetical protein SAMN02745728_01962 [Desulfovibrio litoralis DSM 11393]